MSPLPRILKVLFAILAFGGIFPIADALRELMKPWNPEVTGLIRGHDRTLIWAALTGGCFVTAGCLGMLGNSRTACRLAGLGFFILSAAGAYAQYIEKRKGDEFTWCALGVILGISCWRLARGKQGRPSRDPGGWPSSPNTWGSGASFTPAAGQQFTGKTPVKDSRRSASPPPPVRPSQPPRPAGDTLKHLDAGAFEPLSDAEIKRRVKKAGTGGSWFQMLGMRGRIPPVTDERTLLIDRALVAHGLLTPETLKEIHEVGEEYQRLSKSAEGIHAAGTLASTKALEEDTAARKALQAQKKAEAAARREARAKGVAERKVAAIIHLGRGVSGGLADRRANVEKLEALGLPVLTDPAGIARALGLTIPRLRWLAWHSEASPVSHYIRFTVAKKSGGTRELAAPHFDTARAQKWILINILEKVPVREAAHGFVRGRSIMSNAVPHVRRDVVVNVDLKDFFPTITFPRVRGIFEGLGYSPAAATVLALLCTDSPRRAVTYDGKTLHVATGPRALPQGACTSPALSNLAARKLDSRLNGLARNMGWTYTRYADDLTFSATGEAATRPGGLLQALRRLCVEEGFTVNEKKTRVQRQSTRQTVTGIVVNHRPNVPRDLHRRLRAILHNARTTGLAAQNTDNHPHFALWLRGMIAWVSMANPEKGRKLREALESLRAG